MVHWLADWDSGDEQAWTAPISAKLLQHILQLDPKTSIEGVRERGKQVPPLYNSPYWATIKNNLMVIQEGIRSLNSCPDVPVAFELLMKKLPEST